MFPRILPFPIVPNPLGASRGEYPLTHLSVWIVLAWLLLKESSRTYENIWYVDEEYDKVVDCSQQTKDVLSFLIFRCGGAGAVDHTPFALSQQMSRNNPCHKFDKIRCRTKRMITKNGSTRGKDNSCDKCQIWLTPKPCDNDKNFWTRSW